jgi:hypothetical protein
MAVLKYKIYEVEYYGLEVHNRSIMYARTLLGAKRKVRRRVKNYHLFTSAILRVHGNPTPVWWLNK